ncbi:MAG: helix-turn-helix transcriptional regulator [Clostridium sp.]|nr:helix-turn-helix transcriptional regulator [Clostridium sp.]
MTQEEKCPFTIAQRLIQGKWAILIMHYLSEEPLRFNELLRRMPKMTHATLSNQLKQLEAEGLVIRKEYMQIPPKVEYSLSDIGKEFQPVLESIRDWGEKYIEFQNQ